MKKEEFLQTLDNNEQFMQVLESIQDEDLKKKTKMLTQNLLSGLYDVFSPLAEEISQDPKKAEAIMKVITSGESVVMSEAPSNNEQDKS